MCLKNPRSSRDHYDRILRPSSIQKHILPFPSIFIKMDKFTEFGKSISASFTPFAARSQQFIKEQLGQADDRVCAYNGLLLVPI